MRELRVVIADDSESIRALLEEALSTLCGLRIVGVAEDGAIAIDMIEKTYPDLLVLDVAMPIKNGIEVLRHVRQRNEHPLIVMFTANPSKVLRDACLKEGADHCIDKSELDRLISICKTLLLTG